jgi:hypothetical protein
MLKFELDICQPRFGGSRISQDILFVDGIFLGLLACQHQILFGRLGFRLNSRSDINLVFPERASAWRRLGQPLWAEAHQASSARREIMRSDSGEVGMAGREIKEPLSRLKSRMGLRKMFNDLVRKAATVGAWVKKSLDVPCS